MAATLDDLLKLNGVVAAGEFTPDGRLVAVIAVGAVGVGIFGINVRKKTLKMQTM